MTRLGVVMAFELDGARGCGVRSAGAGLTRAIGGVGSVSAKHSGGECVAKLLDRLGLGLDSHHRGSPNVHLRSSRPPTNRGGWLRVVGLSIVAASAVWAAGKGDIGEFLGTWRGTSTCVNRQIAPACKDETVVYEVRPSDKPMTAVLKADKIVSGQRVPMGELEFTYSQEEGCWRSEFSTPRVHAVWCLTVEGTSMTGSLRMLPANADVRKVELKHD